MSINDVEIDHLIQNNIRITTIHCLITNRLKLKFQYYLEDYSKQWST